MLPQRLPAPNDTSPRRPAALVSDVTVIEADAVVAIDALLRWARASGRDFDAVLPLVTRRFSPAEIVAYMDRTRPGAGSLREVFEAL